MFDQHRDKPVTTPKPQIRPKLGEGEASGGEGLKNHFGSSLCDRGASFFDQTSPHIRWAKICGASSFLSPSPWVEPRRAGRLQRGDQPPARPCNRASPFHVPVPSSVEIRDFSIMTRATDLTLRQAQGPFHTPPFSSPLALLHSRERKPERSILSVVQNQSIPWLSSQPSFILALQLPSILWPLH